MYAVVFQSTTPNCELFATRDDLLNFLLEPANHHYYLYFRETRFFQLKRGHTIDVTEDIRDEAIELMA